jgi:hypothetical protein
VRRDDVKRRVRLLWFVVLLVGSVGWLVACSSESREPWSDSFEDAAGWEFSSDAAAEITVQDEQLLVQVLQPGQVAWATSERTFSDFYLRVDATQLAGPNDNEYGILTRVQDDARFYAFSISGDGYVRAARYEEGSWELLGGDWAQSAAVLQGHATNVLGVEMQGATFTFRVNGEVVLQGEDDALKRGQVGLYAGAFGEPGVLVAFDNVAVEPLE